MNSKRPALTHEQVALHLPEFIRGKLSSEHQRQVQEHIAACQACANEHRQDLDLSRLVEEPPPDLQRLLTPARLEHNRRRVFQRIRQSDSHDVTDNAPETGRSRSGLPAPGQAVIAAGLCALVVGVILLSPGQDPARSDPPLAYQTRSSASAQLPGDYARSYRVVFQPGQTRASIQQTLLALDAVALDGPSAAGVYTLAFPPREKPEDQALYRLRQRPEILLAEPSVHRDR